MRRDEPACEKGVGMTAMVEERPMFENAEWLVLDSGLEHKATGYFIERESLADRRCDGLWTWPMQMAEKSWCAMPLFAEAFSRAASLYDIDAGAELSRSLLVADREISAWPTGAKKRAVPAPLARRTLQAEDPNPILWEPGRGEKSLRNQGPNAQGESLRRHALAGARVFSANGRLRESQTSLMRTAALPWRTSYRLQKTGTKLVRLLQAAWTTR